MQRAVCLPYHFLHWVIPSFVWELIQTTAPFLLQLYTNVLTASVFLQRCPWLPSVPFSICASSFEMHAQQAASKLLLLSIAPFAFSNIIAHGWMVAIPASGALNPTPSHHWGHAFSLDLESVFPRAQVRAWSPRRFLPVGCDIHDDGLPASDLAAPPGRSFPLAFLPPFLRKYCQRIKSKI